MRILNFIIIILLSIVAISIPSCNTEKKQRPIQKVVDEALKFSVQQSLLMANSLINNPDLLPKSINKKGELETCHPDWWVSGFFPGELWYLYEYSQDAIMKELAENYSGRIENEQFDTTTHDVGFIINCSYGNAYRITHNIEYLNVIHNAATSLATRFNPEIGSIRSWNHASWNSRWQYPVIIDNMMNLELLSLASKEFDDQSFREIINAHAQSTMKNHYRSDYSSCHVVSYDTVTFQVESKNTSQGYSDESTWARGQAWGLYGFTMMFRETKDSIYLNQARHIACFLINHPRMPKDKIPYWDFDSPDIPNTYRDASSAAIMCSALIELSRYVDQIESKFYLDVAKTQIRTLCSKEYLSELGENRNFILKHGVGHMPNQTEIDVPLSYADYYFIEALMRFKKYNIQ